MMNPNAKLIARRSASVTAGTALPARVSVAITEPGPTRTNAAVPNISASARCGIECISSDPLYLTSVRQCRTDFTNRTPLQTVCQQAIWRCRNVSLTRSRLPRFGDGCQDDRGRSGLLFGFHAHADRDYQADLGRSPASSRIAALVGRTV